MIALALDVSRFIDAVAALVLFALVCKVVRTRNNLPAEMLAYRLLALAALVKGRFSALEDEPWIEADGASDEGAAPTNGDDGVAKALGDLLGVCEWMALAGAHSAISSCSTSTRNRGRQFSHICVGAVRHASTSHLPLIPSPLRQCQQRRQVQLPTCFATYSSSSFSAAVTSARL